MRLNSVEISNYRVIRHARIELADQMIGIIGPNGSGKSSIVEAISWALYGHQVARSGKEEIKSGFASAADSCAVELSFELKGESYRLIRRLVGKSERSEVELYRAGASESIGIAETRGYIESLLGLDWRGFLTSFLARQQELNALTDLQPSKRREHLAGMLGIDRIDRATESARDSARREADRLLRLADQVNSRDSLNQRITQLRQQTDGLISAVASAAGAAQSAQQKLATDTVLLREQQERETACSCYENQLPAITQSEHLLAESRARIALDLAALDAAQGQIPMLETSVHRLAETRAELNQLRQQQTSETYRQQSRQQLASANESAAAASRSIADLSHQIEQVDQQRLSIPSNLADLLNQTRTELAACRDRSVQLTTQRDTLATSIRKLTKQAESLSELGPDTKCDRCLRPLTAHDLDQVRAHLSEEQAAVAEELSLLEIELQNGIRTRTEIETRLTELERLSQQQSDLTNQRTRLTADLGKSEQQRLAAEDQIKIVSAQLEQLGETSFDPARLAQLEQEIPSLEQAESKLHQLRADLARRDRLESDLAATDQKLADLRTEAEKIRSEIAAIGFDRTVLDQIQRDWHHASEAAESAKSDLIRAEHARDLATQEINLTEQQLGQFEQISQEIEQSRQTQFRSETLARLLGDFKKHLIARIRPRLAELTGHLLADMTDGRYTLVALDEEYRLRLNDLGQFYGIERFSGGETDLANLCLRLAISQALTESAGMDRSFVMLDEVFGSQDEARRDLVVQGLISLRGRFPQMILITHFEELKQKVEMLVELVPTRQGWSEVRVNGAIA